MRTPTNRNEPELVLVVVPVPGSVIWIVDEVASRTGFAMSANTPVAPTMRIGSAAGIGPVTKDAGAEGIGPGKAILSVVVARRESARSEPTIRMPAPGDWGSAVCAL